MSDDKKPTPIPPAVQAKMQTGVRQRYAMGATESIGKPKDERK